MDEMYQSLAEEGWFNPSRSGDGPYPTEEGRLNGGGFIDGPMEVSAQHGKGLWPAPIGAQ